MKATDEAAVEAEAGTKAAATAPSELRQHWLSLLGCTLALGVGVHSLPFYTSGLFMGPLGEAFGWTRTQMSMATTILIAALALLSPFVGMLLDRFGERKVALPSLIVLVAGFFGLSRMNGDLVVFYAVFAFMAVLGAGSSTPTFTRIIARKFDRSRGTALGIGLVSTGLASTLSPLLLTPIIAGGNWRAGYLALAAAVAVATPLFLLFTREPAEAAASRNGTAPGTAGADIGEAARDPVFWILILTFVLISLAASGLVVHFVPLLRDQGLSAEQAGLFASGIGASIIVARLITGVLIDIFFAPRVAAALMAAGASALAIFVLGGPSYALFGAIAIGFSVGAEFDLVAYLCARYFGFRSYGRLYGILYSSVLVGTAISPLLYARIFELTGAYTAALWIAIIGLLATAGLFLSLPRFDRPSPVGKPTASR